MNCSMPGLPVHQQHPEFTHTHVHWVSDAINHLILCRPLILLPSIFPSIRVFSNELDLRIRWLKYWSFSFSLSPSSEYSGLISCRMDWLDLLAKELSKIFSNCIVQRHHFFGTQPSFSSSCHIHTCYCCCYVASVMLDSVWLHGWQPTRLLCCWDSPGKNSEMSCHFLLQRNLSTKQLMLLICGIGEDFWESLGLQGDPTSPSYRKSVLNIHWKDWCRSWNSNTLATWCKELSHLKRPWCWERSKAGG